MDNNRKKKHPANKVPANRPSQEVVYTPPAPLNRKRFILRLLIVATVVLAVFLSFTIFFRVEHIEVSGCSKYTAWSVRDASGIQCGESLLGLGKAEAAGRITQKLRYIKSVRIGVTLPNKVHIHIEELDVVYSVQDQNSRWWLLSSDGVIVDQTTEEKSTRDTIIKGVRILNPVIGEEAKALEQMPKNQEDNFLEAVTCAERLETALAIAKHLEDNEVLGEVAWIDVTDMDHIELWYGDEEYQVKLGTASDLEVKIQRMKTVITKHKMEGGYQSGILDITKAGDNDPVAYTPF